MDDDQNHQKEDRAANQMRFHQKADVGVKWTSMSKVYSIVLTFLSVAVLARILTPKEYGLMGLAMIVIGFGNAFSDSGISAALIHYQKITREQLSTLYWFSILIGIVIYACIFIASPLVSIAFQEPELTGILQVTALNFIITATGNQFHTVLQKEMNFRSISLTDITSSTISTFSTIILAILGSGVMALVLGNLINCSLRSLMIIPLGMSYWKPARVFHFKEVKPFLSFSMYQVGERSVNFMFGNMDKIIIGSVLGTVPLGYYNIAHNLIMNPIHSINPVFTRVYFPYFSKMQDDIGLVKEKYFDLIKTITFLTFPIYLIIIPISPVLVPFLFGPQWIPSVILVQVLSISGVITSLENPIGSLLLSKGYAKRGFMWNVVATILNGIGLSFGTFFGLVGVAWSKTAVKMFLFFIGYFFLLKKCLGPCYREYLRQFLPFLLFAGLGAFISTFFWHPAPLVHLMVQCAFGFGTYLIMIMIFDREFLKHFLKRYLGRHRSEYNKL